MPESSPNIEYSAKPRARVRWRIWILTTLSAICTAPLYILFTIPNGAAWLTEQQWFNSLFLLPVLRAERATHWSLFKAAIGTGIVLPSLAGTLLGKLAAKESKAICEGTVKKPSVVVMIVFVANIFQLAIMSAVAVAFVAAFKGRD